VAAFDSVAPSLKQHMFSEIRRNDDNATDLPAGIDDIFKTVEPKIRRTHEGLIITA
jgi:hypothetical protein